MVAAELWLHRRQRSAEAHLALCNDGYGAGGVGEDMIEVTPT
jgi:hypothetical protein